MSNPSIMQIDTGAVAVPNTSAWTLIATIELGGIYSSAFLLFVVGSADLLGIKLSRSERRGGHAAGAQIDWREDPYFDSGQGISMLGTMTRSSFGNGPLLPKANARKHVNIYSPSLQGVQELGIWAMSANASTLEVTGTFV